MAARPAIHSPGDGNNTPEQQDTTEAQATDTEQPSQPAEQPAEQPATTPAQAKPHEKTDYKPFKW